MTIKILFVCLGNICRSPAAEAVLRTRAKELDLDLVIDSAGTGAWHEGDPPDGRMLKAAAGRGYDLSYIRARKIGFPDFYEFDYILAMDFSNQMDLLEMAPANRKSDIRLFLDFADCEERETPDPYFGGIRGFEDVLDLIEQGMDSFLRHLECES